jgi:hypothetical protein
MLSVKSISSVALMCVLAWSGASSAAVLSLESDGWHSWSIDESGTSSAMCCFSSKGSSGKARGCDLDGRNMSFTDGGDCAAEPGMVTVYVRMNDGDVQDIRVLSANCPVNTASEISDHGQVTMESNLRWFRSVIEDEGQNSGVREEALFGLVQSQSDAAYDYLDSLLSKR